MDLGKCYQCSVNIEISLDLKGYFSLVTCKINNLIALRLTNQITEISAPWWLRRDKDMWQSDNLFTILFYYLNKRY